MADEVVTRIGKYLSDLLRRVSDEERSWLQAHVIDPRSVELANDIEGLAMIRVWLVTDHTGDSDASYRIIYNPTRVASVMNARSKMVASCLWDTSAR